MMSMSTPSREIETQFMTPGTAFAVVLVAAAGVLSAVSWQNPQLAGERLLVIAAFGVAHGALGTLGVSWIERHGRRRHLHGFFAASLAVDIAALVASRGGTYIFLMSLVSQSVLYLGRTGVVLVVGTGSAAVVLVHAIYAATVLDAAKRSVGVGAAFVFVIVFSRMLLQQYRARAELAELATTRERNRIAREIHDGLGHYLTVVHMQLEAAQTVLAVDPEKARGALTKAQELTREGLAEVRRSVAVLREPHVRDPPLIESIRKLASECSVQGIVTDVRASGTQRRLSPAIEATLFRTAQESLTNVRRHARASRLTIELAFTAAQSVRLLVEDDGVGADDIGRGFGLRGLRERAELVGGTLSIRTARGRGFTLEMEVPG
jgi:signal transduction histidine kinase